MKGSGLAKMQDGFVALAMTSPPMYGLTQLTGGYGFVAVFFLK